MTPKFATGSVTITPGMQRAIAAGRLSPPDVSGAIHRHICGDYGTLDAEDIAFNDEALKSPGRRIFSAYEIEGLRFYVITDNAQTPAAATTCLTPDEY